MLKKQRYGELLKLADGQFESFVDKIVGNGWKKIFIPALAIRTSKKILMNHKWI